MAMKLPALVRISFLVLLLTGCSMAPGGKATPTAEAVAPATPMPSIAASPPTTASQQPSSPPKTTIAAPPRGLLASATTEVDGWVGSYCWQNGCVDMAGVPPKSRLPEITAGDDGLTFSLSDGATFTGWTISYGTYSNGEMTILDQGGAPSDPDAQPQSIPPELNSVQFDSPPNGDWVLMVSVQFPDGDLSYAWHVVAE
jgi:hypothetical protein